MSCYYCEGKQSFKQGGLEINIHETELGIYKENKECISIIDDWIEIDFCPFCSDNLGGMTKEEKLESLNKCKGLKDSGERTQFDTGAVRDMSKGKGRLDLIPLSVVAKLMKDNVMTYLAYYQKKGQVKYLYQALEEIMQDDKPCLILELGKHFEKGAEKYGIDNWKKGIPLRSYLDSATRHYLKYMNGENDEDHLIASVWNIVCLIHTIENLEGDNHDK